MCIVYFLFVTLNSKTSQQLSKHFCTIYPVVMVTNCHENSYGKVEKYAPLIEFCMGRLFCMWCSFIWSISSTDLFMILTIVNYWQVAMGGGVDLIPTWGVTSVENRDTSHVIVMKSGVTGVASHVSSGGMLS